MEGTLKVLELYCGIGGMHLALKEAKVSATVVAAMDVNDVTNSIYAANFPHNRLMPRNIESLTAAEFNIMEPDVILASPPCQPFTRTGLKKDAGDPRSASFLHLLDLLPSLNSSCRYILIENVSGFEVSCTRNLFVQRLEECGFQFQEFLLSPHQLGIPNSRLRYYLLAKRTSRGFCFPLQDKVMTNLPAFSQTSDRITMLLKSNGLPVESVLECRPIRDYLETKSAACLQQYLLPEKTLEKYCWVFDIVNKNSRRSCCFTKAYARFAEGTGSVLQQEDKVDLSETFSVVKGSNFEDKATLLKKLRLRYFTPREVANLMGFPSWFRFPMHLSRKQCYRALGNSLNVVVVATLLLLLLEEAGEEMENDMKKESSAQRH